MGDRVSVSFKTGEERSVVVCSHWGGKQFAQKALDFATDLIARRPSEGGMSTPLTRREPCRVVASFLATLEEDECYVVTDRQGCDDSDNGHYTIAFTENGAKASMSKRA